MDASRGHLPVDPTTITQLCPLVPRHALCALPLRPGGSRVRHARRVGGDVGRPHIVLWVTSGQAAPHRRQATQVARTVPVDRSHGFQPVDSFLNRNPFLFYFEFISDSNFENSYVYIQISKNYESSSVGFISIKT
jgi:hypothetical protein